jgi:hypothetical protein
MESFKIWLTTVALAVAYGVAHDQVTARVAIEYFTIGHERVFDTESATLIAMGWGVLATWWVGAIGGLIIAAATRIGGEPRLTLAELLRPGAVLLSAMAVCSLIAGITGYALARADVIAVDPYFAERVPARSHDRFVADAWAHLAAYASGILGCLVLAGWIVATRWRRSVGDSRMPVRRPIPDTAP